MVVQRLNTDVMVFTRIGSKIEIYFYKYAFFFGKQTSTASTENYKDL